MSNQVVPTINDLYKIAYLNNFPISLTIELNTTCNWRCQHCYIPEHSNKGLTSDSIKKILREARELGVYELVLTGGEITLRLDLVEIVEYARELGIVNLLSNASTLNADLVNKLKKLNIRSYSSTVFSMQPHVHDSITRVRGSYFSAIA
ncbi:MAG: radical SAM protein [Bacillota bacterium]|nr:radical SAM protein [Bacillota bacterium]